MKTMKTMKNDINNISMTKLPTLYHGTDARIVRMSAEERKEHKQHCMLVVDFLWPFYDRSIFEIANLIGDEQMTKRPLFWKAFICIGGYKNRNQQYQYEHFSLTNMKERAEAYAYNSFAGGELGLIAYELYQGAKEIGFDGWNPTDEVISAARNIADFAEDVHEPVLFSFDDYDLGLLRMEDGKDLSELSWQSMATGSVKCSLRYLGNAKLDISRATLLKPLKT